MIWKLFMEKKQQLICQLKIFVKPADDKIVVQVTTDPETGEVMVPTGSRLLNRSRPLRSLWQ